MKKLFLIGAIGLLAGVFSCSALAQNGASKEVSTAHVHATLAQKATTVDATHTHLHHVINCLVGPEGEDFDASEANPCEGQGNGALNDAAGNAALQARVKTALAAARSGLQSDSLDTAHQDAAKAAAALKGSATQKSGHDSNG